MYQFHLSTKFKRDFKKSKSQNKDISKFKEIISLLECELRAWVIIGAFSVAEPVEA